MLNNSSLIHSLLQGANKGVWVFVRHFREVKIEPDDTELGSASVG